MPIAYHTTYSDLYRRVASDLDGAAVRALLGSGAASVFPADKLGNTLGIVLPWLVWRAQPVGGSSGGMRDVQGSWFAYAAPNTGTRRLHQIASELEILYGELSVFDMAYGRLMVTHIGEPFTDTALNNITGLEVRIGYRRLG